MSDIRLISSDSHVVEPRDLWQERIEPKYKDRAPRLVREGDLDQWYCEDNYKIGLTGTVTQAGRRFDAPETIRPEGIYDEVREGAWNPDAHIKDSILDSVDASVIYPSIGLTAYAIPSSDLLSAVCCAYNDWLADFCKPYPNQLKGVALLNVDHIEGAVKELKRARDIGLSGGLIPQCPIYERYDAILYEPLWQAAESLDIPLTMHIGTNRWRPDKTPILGSNKQLVDFTNQEYPMRDNVTAILYSDIFERHPNLKIGTAEYEISWAPYLLNRMDQVYRDRPARRVHTFKNGALPSDIFKSHMFVSFQEDDMGIKLRDYVGVNNLLWGSDYPHAESTFPKSREIVDRILEGVPEHEKVLIASANCARVYGIS